MIHEERPASRFQPDLDRLIWKESESTSGLREQTNDRGAQAVPLMRAIDRSAMGRNCSSASALL